MKLGRIFHAAVNAPTNDYRSDRFYDATVPHIESIRKYDLDFALHTLKMGFQYHPGAFHHNMRAAFTD